MHGQQDIKNNLGVYLKYLWWSYSKLIGLYRLRSLVGEAHGFRI
jgi:hypothetical protein